MYVLGLSTCKRSRLPYVRSQTSQCKDPKIFAPSLGLPDWTLNLVIVLLSIGFPITVILSWIFDITPEGVVKTESVEELPDQKPGPAHLPRNDLTPAISSSLFFWWWCVSSSIQRVFKSDQFSELRDEEGLISVAVLPFDNLTGDSSLYFWQNGISEYLINGLGNSDELAVWSSQIISDVLEGTRQVSTASLAPDIARRTASKINASTYITGNFIGTENDVSIMLNLVNTDNGELIWSTRVDGDLESNYRSRAGPAVGYCQELHGNQGPGREVLRRICQMHIQIQPRPTGIILTD